MTQKKNYDKINTPKPFISLIRSRGERRNRPAIFHYFILAIIFKVSYGTNKRARCGKVITEPQRAQKFKKRGRRVKDNEEKDPKPDEGKDPKPDEGKDPKPDEGKDPKPDEGKDPKPEPESEVIKRIRADYEKRIEGIEADYKRQLADKDKTIIDILDGNPAPAMGIAERINQRRIFKKY